MKENKHTGLIVTGLTLLIGFAIFGGILAIDVLAGINCEEIGCNCGHPLILNALYDLME